MIHYEYRQWMVINFFLLVNAEQAEVLHITHKNTQKKLHRTSATVWLNELCSWNHLTTSTVKLPSEVTTSCVITLEGSHNLRINQEIKFLYKKKKINQQCMVMN